MTEPIKIVDVYRILADIIESEFGLNKAERENLLAQIAEYTKIIDSSENNQEKVNAYMRRAAARAELGMIWEAVNDYKQGAYCINIKGEELEKTCASVSRKYIMVGLKRGREKNPKCSLKYFNMAKALQPENPEIYFNIGLAKSNLQLFLEAIPEFNKVLELDPEYKEALMYLGKAKYEEGLLEEAKTDLDIAIMRDPTSRTFTYRGFVEMELGLHKEAKDDFNKAFELNPDDDLKAGIYFSKGTSENHLRDFVAAKKDLTEAINLVPPNSGSGIYYQRGIAEFSLKETEKAIADFDKATALNPTFSKPYFFGGVLKFINGRITEAERDLSIAAQLKPTDVQILNYCGLIKFIVGKHEEAIASLDGAIANSTAADITLPLTYYNSGLAKFVLGRFDDAFKDFSAAVQHAPELAPQVSPFSGMRTALEVWAKTNPNKYKEALHKIAQDLSEIAKTEFTANAEGLYTLAQFR